MAAMSRAAMLVAAMLVAAAVGVAGMLWLNSVQPPAIGDARPHGPSQRIVVFGPNNVECLFAMGAGRRVVGRDSWTSWPPAARKLPDIGSLQTPNYEIIRSLRPDLMILQFAPPGVREFAASAGIPVLQVNMDSLATIRAGIAALGEAIGDPEAARLLNERIEVELEQVRHMVAGRPRPTVMVVVGRKPGTLADILVAGRSYLGELVEVAGGKNLFAGNELSYVPVPLEAIRQQGPEVIVEFRGDALAEQAKDAIRAEWAGLGAVPAVVDGRVYVSDADCALKPGPRIAETARVLAAMIHPETGPMQ
jgi:iron complex transport system substrate-binding protein